MIELRDLWRVYRVGDQFIEAVRGVSFSVAQGEFIAVVGHSGCGKSSLLSMIGGLARPSQGQVLVDGVDIWARDDAFRSDLRNRRIGFMFQFASLIPTLTAMENVLLPNLFAAGRNGAPAKRARELLEMVGLGDKLHSYPNEVSGGQQRRIAIARALINEPAVLLADEPTGDLDEDTEREVMALLLRTLADTRAALVMVTHDRAIAETATRLVEMRNGRLA